MLHVILSILLSFSTGSIIDDAGMSRVKSNANQLLLVFTYPQDGCQSAPTVYISDGEDKERIGSLLTKEAGYSESFVNVYNRDYEYATLRAFEDEGFRPAAFKKTQANACSSKHQFILVKGKRTEPNHELFESDAS